MERGLKVRYLYHDRDLLEVEVIASNGTFAGTTTLYVDRDELSRSADVIQNFPGFRSDERYLNWGSFGSQGAVKDALQLHFRCIDSALHIQVEIQIQHTEDVQFARMIASVEPAAIDKFIPQLRKIEENLSGEAILEFLRS